MSTAHSAISAAPAKSDTREALLDAAEALFAGRSYAGVSVREIVEAARANIAAVNYHFGSKSDLYIATVRRALERSRGDGKWQALECDLTDRRAAAEAIATFIHVFLRDIVQCEHPSAACSLIVREASQPSEAIDAVITHFILPNQQRLKEVVRALMPSASPRQAALMAESIVAQVMHYRVFRVFIERSGVADLSSAADLNAIAGHISRVSLAAAGCTKEVIASAIAAAQASDLHRTGVGADS